MEIWKDIQGYEGFYQVSNKGRIRSLERTVKHSYEGYTKVRKGKILTLCKGKGSRYLMIKLSKNGKYKTFLVHRLVANAFLEKKIGKKIVNHIDGNKTNNNYENLEWCTEKENSQHAKKNGLLSKIEKKVVLQNLENGEIKKFQNRSEACIFLGKSTSYIIQKLNKKQYEFCGYKILI